MQPLVEEGGRCTEEERRQKTSSQKRRKTENARLVASKKKKKKVKMQRLGKAEREVRKKEGRPEKRMIWGEGKEGGGRAPGREVRWREPKG